MLREESAVWHGHLSCVLALHPQYGGKEALNFLVSSVVCTAWHKASTSRKFWLTGVRYLLFSTHSSQPFSARPLSGPCASRWFVGSLWWQESSEGSEWPVGLCCFPLLAEMLCHCLLGCYKQDWIVPLKSFRFSKTRNFDYSGLKYLGFSLAS